MNLCLKAVPEALKIQPSFLLQIQVRAGGVVIVIVVLHWRPIHLPKNESYKFIKTSSKQT